MAAIPQDMVIRNSEWSSPTSSRPSRPNCRTVHTKSLIVAERGRPAAKNMCRQVSWSTRPGSETARAVKVAAVSPPATAATIRQTMAPMTPIPRAAPLASRVARARSAPAAALNRTTNGSPTKARTRPTMKPKVIRARLKAPKSCLVTVRATTIARAALVRLESPWSANVQIIRERPDCCGSSSATAATPSSASEVVTGPGPDKDPERSART